MEEFANSAESSIPTQPQNLPNPTIQIQSQSLPPCENFSSAYIQLCNIVKDLRPHFIEILRTPDFRNCEAANEIRKKMKHMMDVSKQVQMESTSSKMPNKPTESEPLSNEIKNPKGVETLPEVVQVKRHSAERAQEKSPEVPVDRIDPATVVIPGSYIVGGSNLGWNFITYPGEKAVYYGVTKESRQAQKP